MLASPFLAFAVTVLHFYRRPPWHFLQAPRWLCISPPTPIVAKFLRYSPPGTPCSVHGVSPTFLRAWGCTSVHMLRWRWGFAARHVMVWFTVFSFHPFLGCRVCLLIGTPKVAGSGMPCIPAVLHGFGFSGLGSSDYFARVSKSLIASGKAMSTSQPIGIIVEFLGFNIVIDHVLFPVFGFGYFRLLFGCGVSPPATFLPPTTSDMKKVQSSMFRLIWRSCLGFRISFTVQGHPVPRKT